METNNQAVIGIVLKNGNVAMTRKYENVNVKDITEIIGHLEILKLELLEIAKSLMVKQKNE